jgi:hypothetical protein
MMTMIRLNFFFLAWPKPKIEYTGNGRDIKKRDKSKAGETYPPVPRVLISNSVDDVSEDHDQYVWDHSHKTHFWLTDAVVTLCEFHGDPIAERSCCGETDKSTDQESEVEES